MEKIQDYAVIGNGRSIALIAKTGALDWLCWPSLDSYPVFGELLDERKGQWSINPRGSYRVSRRYIGDTPILETTFTTRTGKVVMTDFMPVMAEEDKEDLLLPEQEIVRKVTCVEGQMTLKFFLKLGNENSFYCKHQDLGLRSQVNGHLLILKSTRELQYQGPTIEESMSFRAGETVYFSLSMSTESPAVLPVLGAPTEASLNRSLHYWQTFAQGIRYEGPFRAAVVRSATVLKLLCHAPSGAVIASPTTSLPERIGGDLNWDYRYCWLRDASLTTHAFLSVGLRDEAEAFVSWLLHTTNLSRPRLKVLYDVYGRRVRNEKIREEFKGYRNSFPVRIGNEAQQQKQLDIYGEVICASVNIFSGTEKIDRDTQRMLIDLGNHICEHWQEEDAGMWEVRGRKEHFTHSLLMCWAGLEGLLKLHREGLLHELNTERTETISQKISQTLNTFAWNDELKTFTSTLRGKEVDANLLLLPWYGFPADQQKFERTYWTIQQELSSPSGFLFRNRDAEEGIFVLCSLWTVEYLAQYHTVDAAQILFERILGHANDLGLLSEELDPDTGDLLGNFPLAFSHAGVINAAFALEKRRVAV